MACITFCWRCSRRVNFPRAIERHHVLYGADSIGREIVAYLCADCHETVTDINRFLWGLFQDAFGRDAEKGEWPQMRA